MTFSPASILDLFYLGLLGAASLMVPMKQRAEWFKEWRSELWHVRQTCTSGGRLFLSVEREVAAFCLGAFQDAYCLRQHLWQNSPPFPTTKGSAARCLFLLSAILAVSYGIAVLSPGVRTKRQQQLYQLPPRLVLIQSAGSSDDSVPTIPAEQFLLWKNRRQQLFDGFAFYQIVRQQVSTVSHSQPDLAIAHASSNLFELLGLTLRFTSPSSEKHGAAPTVVLSDELWTRNFGADPQVAGRLIHIGRHEVRIGGVAPAGFRTLPGKIDAWLLEPEDSLSPDLPGFVVARLESSETGHLWSQNGRVTAPRPDGSMGDFFCVPLNNRDEGPWEIFLFAVIVAFLALPATTSLPLGEYRFSTEKRSWSIRLRRWRFLCAKITLLLPIVFFLSLDLAYARTTLHASSAEYIHLIASFSICLFGLRWALRDQRQRCPVCLSRLKHPARVGQPSKTFLAWNGTELICTGGHGLLHIPEWPTSWFSTQRWIYLDASWKVLFSESHAVSSGYF